MDGEGWVSVLKRVVSFGECFGERIGFHDIDGAGERLEGKPRLVSAVNLFGKECVRRNGSVFRTFVHMQIAGQSRQIFD